MSKAVVRSIDLPPGRRTLVVSDIHGNLPLLKGLLRKVGFCREDVLIILGDILERSLGSLNTLRYVMELCEKYTVYPITGNCDVLTLGFMEPKEWAEGFYPRLFRRWGERAALMQMAHEAGVPLNSPADYPAARAVFRERFAPELAFLRGLPTILTNENYIFVHGGVPREDRLEELDAHGCMKNDDFLNQGYRFRRWVVVGHWPVTLYREEIQSAEPILLYDRHTASIDGGCTLKLDGQLNALILPERPGGDFSCVSYDGLPTATALDSQAPSERSVNIRYGHSALEVLSRGRELCRCRHKETGVELEVLTEYLYDWEGETFCEDSTDYRLPVEPGDRLSVVRRLSDRALCKKDGVTGWYFGRLTENRSGEDRI